MTFDIIEREITSRYGEFNRAMFTRLSFNALKCLLNFNRLRSFSCLLVRIELHHFGPSPITCICDLQRYMNIAGRCHWSGYFQIAKFKGCIAQGRDRKHTAEHL